MPEPPARPPSGLSRRGMLVGAALAGSGALALTRPARAAEGAATTIIVDASGGGDYTDLEAAVAAAEPGSVIHVRPGRYEITRGRMNPAAGVRIVGTGYGTHVRARDGLNTNVFQLHQPRVVLELLRVDGNGAAQAPSSSNGIYFDAPGGGAILDCHVHDAAGYNIVGFDGAQHWRVQGNRSYSTGVGASRWPTEGIELHGASHCVIADNIVENIRVNGLLLWNSTGLCRGNTVVGNVVRGCGVCGLWIEDGAHDNVVAGNTFAENTYGIRVGFHGNSGSPRNTAITGNACPRNRYAGIHLWRVADQIVTGNVCEGNGQEGVLLDGAVQSICAENLLRDNGRSGVLARAVTDVTIRGNHSAGNGTSMGVDPHRSGIALQTTGGACRRVIIEGNRCGGAGPPSDAQRWGLSLHGVMTHITLGVNELAGNAARAMLIDRDAVPGVYAVARRRVDARVGRDRTAVPHGLGYVPLTVNITMRSAGQVWVDRVADAEAVYLAADAPDRLATLHVG